MAGELPARLACHVYGLLVSSSYTSAGNLMGSLLGTAMTLGNPGAPDLFLLYRQHQLAVHSLVWVAFTMLINPLRLRTEPRLKLYF